MKIAVVTGASSGIGREFVKQIDDTGFDEIWGIALEEDKLEHLKQELKTHFRYFACDLTVPESFQVYEEALKESNAQVGLLINCSGFGKFGRYDEIPTEQSLNMIDLNCKALVRMTETTIPYMPKGSTIINISSVASFQPIPYINVYAATKVFVKYYSMALSVELKGRGISVTTVCPFWTKTNFFDRAEKSTNKVVTNYVVMYDAHDVVKKALKDARRGKLVSIYGAKTRSLLRLMGMLPRKTVMKIWVKQQKLDKKYK